NRGSAAIGFVTEERGRGWEDNARPGARGGWRTSCGEGGDGAFRPGRGDGLGLQNAARRLRARGRGGGAAPALRDRLLPCCLEERAAPPVTPSRPLRREPLRPGPVA